jgi:hypothetical protein
VRRPSRVNLAQPGGRYAIATGGHFQVAPDAGSIHDVAVDVPCFGHLIFTRIPVAADGRFAAFRRAMGKSRVFTVSIAGGFVTKTEVGLRITATGGGCAPHALQARGRLG